ncbi:DsbA family oxidoreductase [Mycobacterium sp. M1]|uniref:DsbA family oxidoreductase n=1 Tax=Mycolicibacter acidiphilus TaxID=2835306 RepID=A0ABS5RFI7_9MYCO|nr:DsbA family oxidoreductase [Mycolicibacter acidiphilus]MBS9532221.1 DsbA family oxidoreductase [Mycolicibacter acidiphilus]
MVKITLGGDAPRKAGMREPAPVLGIAVRIDTWSDVVCPFCYIGKRKLEAALTQTGVDADVHWHSFELDPHAPPVLQQPMADMLAAKYGFGRDRALAFLDQQRAAAAAVGLDFDYVNIKRGNTFNAHRLIHLGEAHGLAGAVKERFLRGYFTEGAAIGDSAVLTELAVDAGLDRAAVTAVLAGDAYADDVRADERRADELGIHAVPHFVIDGRTVISGAADVSQFVEALRAESAHSER